jgi:hypothetical protein
MKSLKALGITLFIAAGLVLNSGLASAFNANNLMDDGVFTNSGTMSAAQIDSWINQFPGSCIRSQSGFVTADPQGWSSAQNKYLFGGNVTAGKAIYDTAQLYHVNPQVILATLQKEQSVVTGSAGCYPNTPDPATQTNSPCGTAKTPCTTACPHSGGCMNIAMSYGCPNYCTAADEGFSLQLTLGTWLLRFSQQRAYGVLTGYQGYEQGDENFTYSGPMTAGTRQRCAGCQALPYDGNWTTSDGTNVHITNGATASLYVYTPFTSGNNSFDTIFQNWFGSIYDIYTWSVADQYAYTDQTKATPIDLTNLTGGQKIYIGFKARNTGTATWTNSSNPLHVGTTYPADRSSKFCDLTDSPAWLGCNRPANMIESSVDPGAVGTFEFWYQAPPQPGTYDEHFSLLAEGLKWLNDPGLYFHTVVKPPTYSYQVEGQYAYTDANKTTGADLSSLKVGDRVYLVIQVRNVGNVTWYDNGSNPVHLGTSNPLDRSSSFCDSTWLGCNRPAVMNHPVVGVTGLTNFEFWYQPSRTGSYKEYFRPVAEGYGWMNDVGLYYPTEVKFDTAGGTDTLNSDQQLGPDQAIVSSNGRYKLVMQSDGNLVIYSINHALWSSRTAGRSPSKLVMQSDGNLVIYDTQNRAYWSSITSGRGSSRLVMQTDGNLVIYDSANRPTWFSGTNGQL